jgi:lysophospholipase L1-like esterase
MPRGRSRGLALRFASVVLGLLVGVLLTEVGARIVFPDDVAQLSLPAAWFERSDVAGIPYLFRSNAKDWTNNLGLRNSHDIAPRKPAGVFRLLVVGDSVTALRTDGVSSDLLYPSVLEGLLAERLGRPIEVLNLSCPGLSMQQDLDLLRARGLPLDPDLVLVAYAENDPIRTDIGTAANINVSSWFRAVQLLQLWHSRQPQGAPEEWYRPGSEVYRRLEGTFAELSRIASEHPVVLVPLPVLSTEADDQIHIAAVARLCRQNGLRCLDIYPRLLPYLSALPSQRSRDRIHFDSAGHWAVAQALVEPLGALISQSLAQRPRIP